MATKSIDTALAAIIEERERLRTEIQSLEAQLGEVEAAIASLDRLAGNGAHSPGHPRGGGRAGAGRTAGRGPARSRGEGRTSPTMVSLIESYLAEQGRKATHADEILSHLKSLDRAPGGKDPKATIQTTLQQLQKRGRVKNIGRNRWRFVRSRSARESASAGEGNANE